MQRYGITRMTLNSLQALTWGTVTGAVLSAVLLAAGESGMPDVSRVRRADPARPPGTEATDAKRKGDSTAGDRGPNRRVTGPR